jgi:homoserine O-acetyltransferase/O-succinyltransferase
MTLPFGAAARSVEVGLLMDITPDVPFRFECGEEMETITIAYQTYGTLNKEGSNALLMNHGLTGDHYIAGIHPVTGKAGWWDHLIGAGKLFDTDKYFIVATNVIGGCMGSTGPRSINPKTGTPYGLTFPVITIGDMVRSQRLLMDALNIPKWHSVIGGSMGGMLALEWLAHHSDKLDSAIVIAAALRHSPQNIAFHEIGRQAIMADPEWHQGDYGACGSFPVKGLAVARMTAHVTYLSEAALQQKFGRRLQGKQHVAFAFDPDFQVESYLHHQGKSFVERFDPNSYLTLTRAVDYFDLEADANGHIAGLFSGCTSRACIISFSSDWLFPASESRRIVRAMAASGMAVSFTDIHTDKGHDAFLLDEPVFFDTMRGFLAGAERSAI